MRLLLLNLLLWMLLLTSLRITAQQITIALHPVRLQLVGDTVNVKVWAESGLPGQDILVWATNANTSTNVSRSLQFNPASGYYEVRFPLTGFPDDTLLLKISGAHAAAQQIPVIHKASFILAPDALPQINLVKPAGSAVANPEVRLKATVTDNTDSTQLICTMYRPSDAYTETNTFWGSVDTPIDLSASYGKRVFLLVQALDSNHQATALNPILVYVESSPYLVPYFVTNGLIIDFNYNKLLVIDEGPASHPRIVGVPGGSVTSIPFTGKVNTGYLTPQGAVLGVEAPGTGRDSLYDFNNGNLLPVGPLTRGSLQAAGSYCIWTYGNPLQLVSCEVYSDSLMFRDLAGTTNHLIGYAARKVNAQTSINNLQPDGTVWFVDSASRMIKYNANARTIVMQPPIGCGGGELYASPVADSFSVAYMGTDLPMTVIRWNKAGSLMSQISIARRPWLDYQVNGKYLAYSNIPLNNQAIAEIRLADTLGNNMKIAEGGRTVSYIEWLNRSGDLMYTLNGDARWLAPLAAASVNISSELGKTYYRNANWYISIGNTLYNLDLNIQPDMVRTDTLEMVAQSNYQFAKTNFTHNYGPSPLIAVKITALPKHGTLKKGAVNVLLNDVINRVDLNKLVYHPDGSGVTADTIRWNGFNGLTYAGSDGMLRIVQVAPPPSPVITGVLTNYCDTTGIQKIKISNWPVAASLTVVQAKLDAASLAVNAADSSVSFQVSGLAAGAHTLTVIFGNIAGAEDTVAGFTVLATLTPDVNLTANITHVVSLATPVVVTAANAAGGGSAPLYTFARDKDITNILQAESATATLTIDPSTLVIGDNKVYARMKTSATCYSTQTNVDSILIRRDAATGITDVDNPGQLITVFPNPFAGKISVSGLSSGKGYRIVLYNARGQVVYTSEVKNKSLLEIPATGMKPGVYWLTIYDTKKKLIGTEKVVKY